MVIRAPLLYSVEDDGGVDEARYQAPEEDDECDDPERTPKASLAHR
jgi:hypothetical protein